MKEFQRVTITIASDDFGGDHKAPPLDILCQLISDSGGMVDLISIEDIKDMHLEEVTA